MNVVTLNGPNGAGKSCLAESLHRGLPGNVYFEAASGVYRKATALVLEYAGVTQQDVAYDPLDFEVAVDKIIADDFLGKITDPEREWGDLHTKAMDALVGHVATRPEVNQAASDWYGSVVGVAEEAGFDLLVVDGRNPRERIMQELEEPPLIIDLFIDCAVEETARRSLARRGIKDPSEEELADETAIALGRREVDLNRKENPFVEPTDFLLYGGDGDAKRVAEMSYVPAFGLVLPRTIKIDTTEMSKPKVADASLSIIRHSLYLADLLNY